MECVLSQSGKAIEIEDIEARVGELERSSAHYAISGSGQINLIDAPEPGTVVMLCGGLAASAWKRQLSNSRPRNW